MYCRLSLSCNQTQSSQKKLAYIDWLARGTYSTYVSCLNFNLPPLTLTSFPTLLNSHTQSMCPNQHHQRRALRNPSHLEQFCFRLGFTQDCLNYINLQILQFILFTLGPFCFSLNSVILHSNSLKLHVTCAWNYRVRKTRCNEGTFLRAPWTAVVPAGSLGHLTRNMRTQDHASHVFCCAKVWGLSQHLTTTARACSGYFMMHLDTLDSASAPCSWVHRRAWLAPRTISPARPATHVRHMQKLWKKASLGGVDVCVYIYRKGNLCQGPGESRSGALS